MVQRRSEKPKKVKISKKQAQAYKEIAERMQAMKSAKKKKR